MKLNSSLITAACILTSMYCNTAFAAKATDSSKKFIVADYYGIWTEPDQAWEQKFRPDTPFDKLNRLYLAFGKLIHTADGHYTVDFDGDPQHAKQVIQRMKAVNPDADIFLSVQGEATGSMFRGAANDSAFADNLAAFLASYGLNGFDIDWEEGLNKTDLNLLVTRLAHTLHQHGMKLTLAVWQFVNTAYDMEVLKNNLDQINIMSYGTGISLPSCVHAFKNAGFPVDKIIGGIETERGYHQFGGETDTLGPNGTIIAKASFAQTNGLAGIMNWRLDNDYTTKENPNYPTYSGAALLAPYLPGK